MTCCLCEKKPSSIQKHAGIEEEIPSAGEGSALMTETWYSIPSLSFNANISIGVAL